MTEAPKALLRCLAFHWLINITIPLKIQALQTPAEPHAHLDIAFQKHSWTKACSCNVSLPYMASRVHANVSSCNHRGFHVLNHEGKHERLSQEAWLRMRIVSLDCCRGSELQMHVYIMYMEKSRPQDDQYKCSPFQTGNHWQGC